MKVHGEDISGVSAWARPILLPMNHDIPALQFGPQGEVMAHAIDACVHCGFCLPACPTYALLGDEMDSPRGRIVLMKEVLEGALELEDAAPHLDRCLGCQGCVTACPSGVPYGELITSFRGWSEPQRERTPLDRAKRFTILKALPAPKLFSVAARVGQYAKPLSPALPAALKAPLDLLPEHVPAMQPQPRVTPARGKRRGRVAFLAGCAQQALTPNFNAATLRVLSRNGIEVVIPEGQGCCGAAALHTGAREEALKLVRNNLRAFNPDDYDAIISNAAGCGAGTAAGCGGSALGGAQALELGVGAHDAGQRAFIGERQREVTQLHRAQCGGVPGGSSAQDQNVVLVVGHVGSLGVRVLGFGCPPEARSRV